MGKKKKNVVRVSTAKQIDEEWKALSEKWLKVPKFSHSSGSAQSPRPYYSPISGLESERILKNRAVRSLGSWVTGTHPANSTPEYTGTAVLGVCTMHKSNAVPVFSSEDAQAISKMRR